MLESILNLLNGKSSKQKLEEEKHKALLNDISGTIGILVGNELSKNSQKATDAMTDGMRLVLNEIDHRKNTGSSQAMGHFFEYIETAKFNSEAAKRGSDIIAIVTAEGKVPGYDVHSEADIVLMKNGSVIKKIQAKAYQNTHQAVKAQTGGINGLGKYDGMDRLIPKDQDLEEAKQYAKIQSEMGLSNAPQYKDVHDKLTNELNGDDGISSGGTTFEELQEARNNPEKYVNNLKYKEFQNEVATTAGNMAIASGVTTAIVSTIKNTYEIFKDGKELNEAIKDVFKDSGKSAARGAVTGAGSASLRYFANSKNIPILNESSASTVIAGSAIDCGVTLWKFANGEINGAEAAEELSVTATKGVGTVLLTKGIGYVLGASTGALLPIAIYSTLSITLSAGYEIVKNAKLRKEEYERIEVLLQEMSKERAKYYNEVLTTIENIEKKQKETLKEIFVNIDENLFYGSNYEKALTTFSKLSNQLGISLKYETEVEFRRFMQSNESLVFD